MSVYKWVPGFPQSVPEARDEMVKVGYWGSLMLGQVIEQHHLSGQGLNQSTITFLHTSLVEGQLVGGG